MASERTVIDYARSADTFSVSDLKQLMDRHDSTEYSR